MSIKPIETYYNGYRFRSRLEARWAVFFDAAGIKYQYEPEGFEVGEWKYLPDFYLPDLGVYVEVKPNIEKLRADSEKLAWMVDFNGPCAKGLLILGQIPNVNMFSQDFECKPNIPKFLICYWEKKWVEARFATFTKNGFLLKDEDLPACVTSAPDLIDFNMRPFRLEFSDLYLTSFDFVLRSAQNERILCDLRYWDMIPYDAYEKARYARFEHGETPEA